MPDITLNDKGAKATVHEATGKDDLVALSIRLKMEPHLTEFENLEANYLFQERFANCIAQTDELSGIDYTLPDPQAEGEALAEAYREWLALPKSMVRRWYTGIDNVETFNAPDLLPSNMLTEDQKKIQRSPEKEKLNVNV